MCIFDNVSERKDTDCASRSKISQYGRSLNSQTKVCLLIIIVAYGPLNPWDSGAVLMRTVQ